MTLREAATNLSDRRTLMDDGFWVSQKEMRALDTALAERDVVYAVVFSNYEPAETDSLWSDKAKAQARAEELNDKPSGWGWEVVKWVLADAEVPV